VSAAALAGVPLCAATACGSSTSSGSAEANEPTTTWEEPASYAYTLTSTTQVLAGTFRVKVRAGGVTEAVGADVDSRRQAQELPAEVPTIGELLRRLKKARSEDADTAEADFAAGGHPVRISLDRDKNAKAIDDEALYVISSYEPPRRRPGRWLSARAVPEERARRPRTVGEADGFGEGECDLARSCLEDGGVGRFGPGDAGVGGGGSRTAEEEREHRADQEQDGQWCPGAARCRGHEARLRIGGGRRGVAAGPPL
jgi:hypothetical protein